LSKLAKDSHKNSGINKTEDFLEYFLNIKYKVKNAVIMMLIKE